MRQAAVPSAVTARLAALAAVGLLALAAVVLLSSGGGGPAVPGMPAAVSAELGAHPTTLTLRGDALTLTAEPEVQRLAALEAAISRQSFAAAEYGPISWLTAQFASIGRRVNARASARVPRKDLLVRAGATGGLNLADQQLTSTLLFGTGVGPVATVRWLVPSANAIRIFVRTTGPMSQAEVDRVLSRLAQRAGLTAVQSVSTSS